MSLEIQSRVVDRLIATGKSDEPWALIVLASMDGAEQLDGFLDKKTSVVPPQRPDAATLVVTEPPGAYVSSIGVEGFRGVGRAAALTLRPGPGLTLVVGRNGSGKSSFAEGLEYLLTAKNYRWEKRPKVWLEGCGAQRPGTARFGPGAGRPCRHRRGTIAARARLKHRRQNGPPNGTAAT